MATSSALSDEALLFGEEIPPVLLGLDAQARQQSIGGPSAPERLVVLDLSEQHEPEAFADWTEAREQLRELRLPRLRGQAQPQARPDLAPPQAPGGPRGLPRSLPPV